MTMIIFNVKDKEFSEFGKVINEDFSELLELLAKKECPENKTIYTQSDFEMENTETASIFRREHFGGMPVQIGYCNGSNHALNCLEYHKSSEIDIAEGDVILLLGR